MNSKKFLITAVTLLMIFASVFARAKKSQASESKLKIVATIFPQYDWAREILGQKASDADLTLLVGNGVDLHSYQPSIQDVAKISTADIFIFTGGESDGWVKDALNNARNKKMTVINMMESLGEWVKAEEIKEGMQAEDGEKDEIEYDEHVWLSLRNAQYLCGVIADAIIEKDGANAAFYRQNLAGYQEKLKRLDERFAGAVNSGSKRTILFGDRFPFRYMADDYGLDYFAAFAGCSAETEASFATVIFLAKKVDQLGLNAVLTIESGDGKIARTIVQSCNSKDAAILRMDSMQSVTAAQIKGGATYASIMEKNLGVLAQALR